MQQKPLTEREEEVSELLGQGLSQREIAAQLVIAPRTVYAHVTAIREKLGCRNTHLVRLTAAKIERPAGTAPVSISKPGSAP
jgi:DNA-binding CsgD family transcriptional regulator